MSIVRSHDLTPIETPGGNASIGLATPSRGAAEVSVIRQRQQPGGANPLHSHDREEVMVVLAGSVAIALGGDDEVVASAGDTVIVPARTGHRVVARGDAPAEWLLIAPAGVRFFHATGEEGHPPFAR